MCATILQPWRTVIRLLFIFQVLKASSATETDHSPNFHIDYDKNTFMKDGQPFRYISGSFHYFRTVEGKWDDILRKFRLAGLNTVQTYVEWASHQPTSAQNFTFEGNLNLFKFLNLAQNNNLSVILRVGPYIDAERDMGGLPPWLLWQSPDIKLRTTQSDFVYYVSNWFGILLTMIKPYLYKNGGPIIMIQIENEYGSYGCDSEYKLFVRDLVQFHLGNDVVLFTTDGATDSQLRCGAIPGVYPTVDFPPEKLESLIDFHFSTQRVAAPKGPLVNSEFYIGRFDAWGSKHSKRTTDLVTASLERILQLGANVNFYMFFGGSSFGVTSGSAVSKNMEFNVYTTSYDYDGALDEAGDPTEKFFAIKSAISQFVPVPEENPGMSPKGLYGNVSMQRMGSIFDDKVLQIIDPKPIVSLFPQRFENVNVGSGFVMYETFVDILPSDPVLLSIQDLKDRAYVYVEKALVGILDRSLNIFSMPVRIQIGQRLSILVENMGRPSFGPQISESKGIGPEVKLGRHLLNSWKHYRFGSIHGKVLRKLYDELSLSAREASFLNEINSIEEEFPAVVAPATIPFDPHQCLIMSPWTVPEQAGVFYYGTFVINSTEAVADTYINTDKWSKGLLWVNGFHLGRYWPRMGPQRTLYLPRQLLRSYPKENVIILFELESAPIDCILNSFFQKLSNNSCSIELVDQPILDGPTPY